MQLRASQGPPGSLRSFFLRLKRHTSSGLYVPELDGLRFVAIFFVFLYHLAGDVVRHNPPDVPPPTSTLYVLLEQLNIGVPLFFAISGMILGLPFARYWLQGGAPVSLKRYFLRRVTRLEPPYVAALLLLFSAKLLGHRGTVSEMLPHLGASLVYLHTLLYRELSSINPVAWSLEVEVQFYILAPLLALVFAVRAAWLRRAIIVTAILLAALWTPWIADLNAARMNSLTWIKHLSLLGNIQYFLAGFLLAEFFLLLPPATHRHRSWDVVSLLGWPALLYLLVAAPDFAFLTLPWLILALYLAVFYGPSSNRAFATVWVASIGGMCYSIYLLHNYAIASLGFLTERVGQTLPFAARFGIQLLLMTPIVLIISIGFYLLIEQPCMRSDWPARLKAFLFRKNRSGALAAKGA
ncbi:MAG TPA: acyltransferase [Bryobacteraceae bacterium]|jgi:peptidoglycan/LPS O-acetylase OafA/YrhL